MEYAAISLAVAGFVFAIVALGRSKAAAREVEDARSDARRRVENLSEEIRTALETNRRMMASLAEGRSLSREMILDGRLWRDVDPNEGQRLVAGGEVRLLDVRTPHETAGGVIPGAVLIPIDQLEERLSEVPRDGQQTLVYCAGGGRSAAACEFLSTQGYDNLHNLSGGYQSWSGPTARPE